MKYYIIKPSSHKVDKDIVEGLKRVDNDAKIVQNLYQSDRAILQKGWTKSKNALAEYNLAKEKKIMCLEGYLFRDKYSIHLN